MNEDCRLIVFARFPEVGKVKTRLACAMGNTEACALYRCFVSDVIALVRTTGYPATVFFDPPTARDAMVAWLGEGLSYEEQVGNDLGERMFHALQKAFLDGCRRAVLIGTDCPDLPAALVSKAFDSLLYHDVVLGPSSDGGYYLIGFSGSHLAESMFQGLDWGGSSVCDATLAICRQAGVDVHVLPSWDDIDDIEDLKRFVERNEHKKPGTSSTLDYLRDRPSII